MFDSIKNKFGLTKTEDEGNKGRKKKIENIVFLIIILIITVIIINNVWSEDSEKSKEQSDKVLAKVLETDSAQEITGYYTLQQNLENILETMEGVGKVKVLINRKNQR